MKSTKITCSLVLACLCTLTACTSYIAHQIVEAPNRLQTPAEKQPDVAAYLGRLSAQDFSRTAMVPVGPPSAELSVAVLPPGNANMVYHAEIGKHQFDIHFEVNTLQRYSSSPKGTIVLLPSFQDSKFTLLPWAFVFAKAGYQCVLVDLRGEGLSTGEWITWGNTESRDVIQLIQWLNSRNIVAGPLVLMGVSYGASVALRAAALDSQVKAVVAIEPFVNAVDVIKRGGRVLHPTLSRFVSNAEIDKAIHEADILAGTKLESANTLSAARMLNIPVLYIHGSKDRFILEPEARQLTANTKDSRYISVMGAYHITLPIEMPKYRQQVLNWLLTELQSGNTTISNNRKAGSVPGF